MRDTVGVRSTVEVRDTVGVRDCVRDIVGEIDTVGVRRMLHGGVIGTFLRLRMRVVHFPPDKLLAGGDCVLDTETG